MAIIDADGNVLYRGIITKNVKRATSFNLNNLPDGQYYLTAGNSAWWMSQGLTIKANALNVDDRNLQQLAQPILTAYEKNKIEVILPDKNIDEANVAIYDAQNVLVQTDRLKVRFAGSICRACPMVLTPLWLARIRSSLRPVLTFSTKLFD